jgi:hypothetical protein
MNEPLTEMERMMQGLGETAQETVASGSNVAVMERPIVTQAVARKGFVPWKKGESGNPLGTKRAGNTVAHWYNIMASNKWTWDRCADVVADKKAPMAKVAAAKQWLTACSSESERHAGDSLDRICDRTAGKPVAFTAMTQTIIHQVEDSQLGALSEQELVLIASIRSKMASVALP